MVYAAIIIRKASNGYIVSGVEDEQKTDVVLALTTENMVKEVGTLVKSLVNEKEVIMQALEAHEPTTENDDD